MNMNLKAKILTAKSLRASFNNTQRTLLTETFYSDENILAMVKEMQEQHEIFKALAAEIREESPEEYNKQILGL